MSAKAIDAELTREAPFASERADSAGPSELLKRNAAACGSRAAFGDQFDREAWSGRPAATMSYGEADRRVEALAALLRGFGLARRSPVAVSLPNGTEACLTIAAVQRAGLTPVLFPVSWGSETIATMVEELGVACALTQARIAELRPALMWRDVAAGYFGLRFLLAFGPETPDGVIDVDRALEAGVVAASPAAGAQADLDDRDADEPGFVSFDRGQETPVPVFRTWRSAEAAASHFLSTARYAPDERIVTLLAQDDFRALSTGLLASLLSGARLSSHGLFSSRALARSIEEPSPLRIVAPGWMEADLARLNLGRNVAGVVLVHEAPVRFKARAPLTSGVVDALSFGETAILANARDGRGQFALSLDKQPTETGLPAPVLEVRRDEAGRIHFRGPAAQTNPHWPQGPRGTTTDAWVSTPYTADVFAGIVIGVNKIDKL